jgi:hypothetical protein
MSKLSVEFGAVDNGLTATLGKINGSLNDIDKNTKRAADSVEKSFSTMVKAGAALALGFGAIKAAAALVSGTLGTFKDALDLGGTLADMSARTGIAIKDLVVLGRAFENAGKSADDVGGVINKMQKAIIEAGEGVVKPKLAFETLGISLEEIKKKSPADQLELIGKAISSIQDPALKSKTAMDIFGKSGGEMLAFFESGKGGIEGARKELGSFAAIMGLNAAQMDTISDQFNAIKNKALEFAAGMLSKLLPAIELVTTALSRIDAAALGAKLGEVITGGSNAMKGFSDALAAVKLGEFGTAFDIAFNSIKLQAADSINSIYANLKGLFAAIPVFLDQSGILMIIDNLVMGIANKLSSSLRSVIAEFLQSIGRLGAAADMRLLSDADADRAKLYFNLVNVGVANIGHNVEQAGDAAKAAFDKAKAGAGKLIETGKLENDLQAAKIGLLKKQAEEAMKAADQINTNGILDVKFSGQRVTNAERIKELEGEIKDARAQGNEVLAKELEATKAYYDQLERSLEKGLTQQDALAAAAKAYQASIDGAVVAEEKKVGVLKEQLGIVEKITQAILAAQQAQGIDKGGKLQNQIQQQIDGGNFKRAKRLNERLADKIDEDLIRRKDGKVDRRNLNDIAKDMGIDVFRMDKDEMRAAIIKKRQDDLKPENKGLNKKEKAEKAEADKPAKADPVDSLTRLVEKIHGLVAKIEPKLPQHALN